MFGIRVYTPLPFFFLIDHLFPFFHQKKKKKRITTSMKNTFCRITRLLVHLLTSLKRKTIKIRLAKKKKENNLVLIY